jgi:hypothetical protein
MVWMFMRPRGQAKLLDQVRTNQVVAASSINDDSRTAIFNHEYNLEQIMALHPLCLCHLCTEYSVYNANALFAGIVRAQRKSILGSRCIINVVFLYIRSANVTSIIHDNICPFAWTFFCHMTKSLTAMALYGGSTL